MMNSQKTIIVIGGSGLIGKVLVQNLKRTFNVVNADLKENSGDGALFNETNITSEESLHQLVQAVEKKFGKIEAVVNCAYPRGQGYGDPVEKVSYQNFCGNLNLHLGGYFLVAKVFAEYFKKQKHGNLIQFASIYGIHAPRFDIYPQGMTSPIEYAAIKAGILQMNSYFAKYYAGNNIRFNCISPGGVRNQESKEFISNYSKHALNQGMLKTNDLVGLVQFLLSDGSKMINGQNIVIDDGWTL